MIPSELIQLCILCPFHPSSSVIRVSKAISYMRLTIQGSCTFEDISQECPTWFLNLEVHKRQRLCKLYREYQAESGLLYRELSSPGTRTEMDRNLKRLNILRDNVMTIFQDEGLRGIEVQQINDFMKWRQDYVSTFVYRIRSVI